MDDNTNNNVQQKEEQARTIKNKAALIAAMQKCLGIISEACRMTELSRDTFYKYYKNDPEFKKACDDTSELAVDLAESKLFELVNGVVVEKEGMEGPRVYQRPPDTTATIFLLKTRGKKRGYIEKSEVETTHKNADGETLKLSIDVKTASNKEIDDVLESLLQ